MRRERGDEPKGALAAMGTARDIDAGEALPERGDGLGGGGCLALGSGRIEGGASAKKKGTLVAVGDEPVVADAVEAARQDVQCEAAQEFQWIERENFALAGAGVVLEAKAH